MSLGAGRARLVRQLLVEALALAIPGGIVGVLAATWGVDSAGGRRARGIPRLRDVAVDPLVRRLRRHAHAGDDAGRSGSRRPLGLASPGDQPLLAPGQRRGRTAGHALGGTARSSSASWRWRRCWSSARLLLTASLMAATRVDLGFATEGRLAAELTLARDRYLRSGRRR